MCSFVLYRTVSEESLDFFGRDRCSCLPGVEGEEDHQNFEGVLIDPVPHRAFEVRVESFAEHAVADQGGEYRDAPVTVQERGVGP